MKQIFFVLSVLLFFIGMGVPVEAYDDMQEGVNIHGFISQGYITSGEYNYLADKSEDGSFEYNEMGLNFSKSLTDELRMSVQLFSRDLGDVANNTINLDYAYGDYRWRDWLGVRIGRIRVPLGLWNEIRDYDMLRPWIVLPQQLYNDMTRDAWVAANGIGLYGNLEAGPVGDFDYYLITGIIYPNKDQGYGKYLSNIFGGYGELTSDPDTKTMYAGSLKWHTPLPGLMLGIWASKEEITAELAIEYGTYEYELELETEKIATGVMAEYSWNELSLWGEFFKEDKEWAIVGYNDEQKLSPEGYYIGAAYRFTDWFQLGGYFSFSYADGNDKNGDDEDPRHKAWQQDIALTLRFDFNEYTVLKLEGHQMDGTGAVLAVDNPESDFSEEDWYYGVAKLTISF